MLQLMKYEFRKTRFSKMVLLAITAILEVLFLAGIFLDWENGIGWGTIGLTFCAMIGVFYIGLESLMVFHRDLNTKQSYMLFLTPRDSFQILGSKVIENGISLFLAGSFFVLLGMLDLSVVMAYYGELRNFLDMLRELLSVFEIHVDVTTADVLFVILSLLFSWLMTIVTGMLAVILAATVLAGKKFSGVVSFAIFLLLTWGCQSVMNLVPELPGLLYYLPGIALALLFTVVMYLISGWIMEKQLSV
ncbi:MAG: hypothetical protein LIP11_18940 [Clostridiales bacterium]|nr:hypothetical protein [Clostridiales bacterium]